MWNRHGKPLTIGEEFKDALAKLEALWVAKTSSAAKPLICSDLWPNYSTLFFAFWSCPKPHEQQFAMHRRHWCFPGARTLLSA